MLWLKPPPNEVASESVSPSEIHTSQDTELSQWLQFSIPLSLFLGSIHQQTQSTKVQHKKVMEKKSFQTHSTLYLAISLCLNPSSSTCTKLNLHVKAQDYFVVQQVRAATIDQRRRFRRLHKFIDAQIDASTRRLVMVNW